MVLIKTLKKEHACYEVRLRSTEPEYLKSFLEGVVWHWAGANQFFCENCTYVRYNF